MISVKFEQTDKGTIVFTCKGHAGQAEKGQDIVCASASMLAYTLAQNIIFLQDRGVFKGKARAMLNDGDAHISCKPKKSEMADVLRTFFVVQVGYSLLAHNYPQYVELKLFGQA
jgi:uncharacterized protein YsxB (DUF464 family)